MVTRASPVAREIRSLHELQNYIQTAPRNDYGPTMLVVGVFRPEKYPEGAATLSAYVCK